MCLSSLPKSKSIFYKIIDFEALENKKKPRTNLVVGTYSKTLNVAIWYEFALFSLKNYTLGGQSGRETIKLLMCK